MKKLNYETAIPSDITPNWNEAPEGTTHAGYIEDCGLDTTTDWEWLMYNGIDCFFWRDGWQMDTHFNDFGFCDVVAKPLSEDILELLQVGSKWKQVSGEVYTVLNLANLESTDPSGRPYTVIYKDSYDKVWSISVYEWLNSFIYESSYEKSIKDEAESLAKYLCTKAGNNPECKYTVHDRSIFPYEEHKVYRWEAYLQDAYDFLELKRELG